ncbi:nuclear pore complex protein Nup153-like isoform X2 [Scyliorhinus canicula]|uniref:nuclear pore complex protein Nup153-like isoform X2 n=1 Tax=Scyliorhinus canicula TaxID=7830 RepID=UPI0018F61DD7|nr:nuclear pore complex protein Nup153-like isoform X2 [Scyliorhinus canicula]
MVEIKECEQRKEEPVEEMPVQDPAASTCVSINKVPHKRLAETPINEIAPKRELNCSTSCSKVQSVHTLKKGCTDVIKKSPLPNRISTGHFTAWGVEDNEVLYYMLKDGQSVGTAFVPTSCEEGPKPSQRLQNYNNNCRNEEERFTISPFRAIQTKVKRKHFATWMTSDSRTNPKTLFYSHFSENPVNKSMTSFSKASSKCVERNSPNSFDEWICDTCSITNSAPAVRCRGCEVLKCGLALQRQWTPAADESIATSCKGTQTDEMSTQAQSSDICIVTNPQNIDVTEMPAPLATSSCSHINEVICSVPQMAASANTSSISIVELLPAGSECENVLLPTEANPTACLLVASAGSGHDENLPRGKRKQQKSVQKDRDSLTPDKSDARRSCSIQESSISISFPHVFGPSSSYRTNSCTGQSMVACPASSKSDMTTTAVASTSFQAPAFTFKCSNKAGRNDISSGTFASSVTFPSVFGQTRSALTSGVVNTGLTNNPSSAQFTEMSTQAQSSDICIVTNPQNIDVTEMSAPLATSSCSHINEVICSVPQTVASANTSSISIVELLPAGSECENVLLPTEANPTACLLVASAGSGYDENLPRGKQKQQKSVQKDRDSLTPDKSDARRSCSIQESSISISFPRVFDPSSSYRTNSCTGQSMVACPASSKSDMTTTAVASTSFQAPAFTFKCSNEAGRNDISSGTFASSVTFPSVFGQTRSALTSGVINTGLTDNPSSAQFTGTGFHFSGNMVPNCNFCGPTSNNVFQFGANVPTQPTCQESFHLSPITTTRLPVVAMKE